MAQSLLATQVYILEQCRTSEPSIDPVLTRDVMTRDSSIATAYTRHLAMMKGFDTLYPSLTVSTGILSGYRSGGDVDVRFDQA